MTDDPWAPLADRFVDGAYATVKGRVRTHVLHQHLLEHLAPPPATVLDVGGGAGHQSFPLAHMGYRVTILDPSEAMLDRARRRLEAEPAGVQDRVRLVLGDGEGAAEATRGERFDAVLCHGVLMYLDDPGPMMAAIAGRAAPGATVSVMALNAAALAVRPALDGRWADALAAFDATRERGVLGVDTRADTVEDLSKRFAANGIEPAAWYGVWLFCDWTDVADADAVEVAAVELRASRQDPYRGLSRVFHLVGRRGH